MVSVRKYIKHSSDMFGQNHFWNTPTEMDTDAHFVQRNIFV